MNTFGERLRSLRLENGVSVSDLSHIIGVTRCSIYRWEKGGKPPKSHEVITLVSDFFHVTPDYFFKTFIISDTDIRFELQQLRAEVNSLRQSIKKGVLKSN